MDSPGFVLQRNELAGIKGTCLTCNTVGKGMELAANASGIQNVVTSCHRCLRDRYQCRGVPFLLPDLDGILSKYWHNHL